MEEAWRKQASERLAKLRSPNPLSARRILALSNFLKTKGMSSDARFVPSVSLDPSQIRDRRWDTRSEAIAGIRNAAPIVNVTLNVTAAQVTKAVTIQRRYGPSGGSRVRDAGGATGGGA